MGLWEEGRQCVGACVAWFYLAHVYVCGMHGWSSFVCLCFCVCVYVCVFDMGIPMCVFCVCVCLSVCFLWVLRCMLYHTRVAHK